MKPMSGIVRPGAPMKPLTEEQKKAELIRVSQQKLSAMTEGAIFNLLHNPAFFDEKMSNSPAETVAYARAIAEEYVKVTYGVTFHKVEEKTDKAE